MADEPRIRTFCRWPLCGVCFEGHGQEDSSSLRRDRPGGFPFFLSPGGAYPYEGRSGSFFKRVNPGDTFQLAFLHSIALSDVRDFFLIDAEYRLVLTETRFQGQGTGLPFNPAQGEKLHREGDWFRITGMRRVVPSIPWRVQSQWQNRFRFGNDPGIGSFRQDRRRLDSYPGSKNEPGFLFGNLVKSKNLK